VEAPKKIEEPVVQTYSEIPVQEVFLEEVTQTFPGRVEQAVSTPVKKKRRDGTASREFHRQPSIRQGICDHTLS